MSFDMIILNQGIKTKQSMCADNFLVNIKNDDLYKDIANDVAEKISRFKI